MTTPTFYNEQQSREALAIFNEAAKIAFDYSVNVWEKQVAIAKQNADRVSQAMDTQQWNSPEEAFNYQRQSGAEILSEWQKFGAEYYELTDAAGKDLTQVAQKGRVFAEKTLDDAAQQWGEKLSVDKEMVYPAVVRQTARTMGDLCQNSIGAAQQAVRAGAETVLAEQKAAAARPAANGAKRKKR